jgi:hypothetical protein
MSKLISFAGYSRVAGELKFRTATDQKRIEQLAKLGDTDINIIKLASPVATKNEAVKAVIQLYGNAEAEVSEFLTGMVKDENPFVKPAKAKAKKEVVVKVQVARARKAKANEPRELTAKELAALQFIAFPVGNGAMAYYPAPKATVSVEAGDEAAV